MCRAGHDATYALMGGWCEICSVRYATRSEPLPAVVDMDVGGEVIEPEADSPVFVVEARERFESWAETFDSTTVEEDDLSTVGEDQPFMESRLPIPPPRPDLEAFPWLIAPVVSEWRCDFGGDSTWVVMIGVRSSESYEIGLTSQCMRKFSPRTELYGLQGLPRCEQRVGGRNLSGGKRMKAAYDMSNIFRKGKTQNCQHALEGVVVVIDAIHDL
jgi:hypothetical protein